MRPRPHPARPAWGLRASAAAYRFRESLFLLPALLVAGGVALAELTALVDESIDQRSYPLTVGMSSNAATWLLSTVAGATITTAGVVFSLTVVSLQLASSQFSPRVMRSFIRDRLSQTVIGLLVATFVYCVLTLRQLSGESTDAAPRVALTVAVVLTVTTVLVIIAHLDHLAHGLQVGHVVRSIAAEGEQVIEAVRRTVREEQVAPEESGDRDGAPGWVVRAPRDGWVSQAPSAYLLRTVPPGSTLRLETRNGAYIHEGEELVSVSPAPDDPERVARRLTASVVVSDTRTMQQDVDFAVRQLVDIGLRALSSPVSDPTTAVEVVLRLGSLLRRLLVEDLPAVAVAGPSGRVLLRPWELTHEEYVEHAFDELRQASAGQPQVVSALLRVLRMLAAHVQEEDRPELVPALRHQLDLLLAAVRDAPGQEADRRRLLALGSDTTDPADHRNAQPSHEPPAG